MYNQQPISVHRYQYILTGLVIMNTRYSKQTAQLFLLSKSVVLLTDFISNKKPSSLS